MRKFDPILQLAQDSPNELSDIQIRYHKVCRSEFTLKQSLAKCAEQWNSSSADASDRANRRSTRDEPSSNKGRVYGIKCIFCLSVAKYPKNTLGKPLIMRLNFLKKCWLQRLCKA